VLGGDGEVRAAQRPVGQAESLERLGAGHLVHQVQVDVEQVGLTLGAPDDVLLPDLFGHRAGHVRRLLASRRLSWGSRRRTPVPSATGAEILPALSARTGWRICIPNSETAISSHGQL